MPIRRLGFWNVALVVAAAAALIVDGELHAEGGLSPGAYALSVLAAAPLAWRARAPLAALVGAEAGAVVCVALFDAGSAATGMVIVQLYTVALLGDRQRSLVAGAVTAIAVIVAILLVEGSFDSGAVAGRVPLVLGSLGLGDWIRSRRALRAAAYELAEREEREREEEGRRRAVQERLRIARELHDTLAHSLVEINVLASVAVDLDGAQDPSWALRDVKEVSATALRDLRATLHLLRDQNDPAPTAPAFAGTARPVYEPVASR